jgi:hypothetical protein
VLGIWLVIPFLTVYLLAPLIIAAFRRESLSDAVDFHSLPIGLAYCAIPAVCGTAILWVTPIRRPRTGILIGALIAIFGAKSATYP